MLVLHCLGAMLIPPLIIQFMFGHKGVSENLKLGKERSRNLEKAFSGSVWKMFFPNKDLWNGYDPYVLGR